MTKKQKLKKTIDKFQKKMYNFFISVTITNYEVVLYLIEELGGK